MASAEELLMSALGSGSEKLIINSDLRTITIPKTITNLGVESDEDVKRLYFQMPRHYGEFDLSEFAIRINYKNAKEEGDVYGVSDAVVTDDAITFSWLVSRHVVVYQGDVEFSVCLRLIDAVGEILKEFNTTPASLPVLRGLETSEGVDKVMHDALATTALEAIERAKDTELKGDPGYTPVKGKDYYTPDERESFANDIIRDHNGVFANAIHGSAKGAVVRLDDVSPIEHTVKVKVGGKNLFGLTGRVVSDFNGYGPDVARAFIGNAIYVGVASSNYYYKNNASYTHDDTTGETIVTSNGAWYGVGIDVRVKPNTTYTVSGDISEYGYIAIAEYDVNGTFLKGTSSKTPTFTTTSNTDWILVILTSSQGKTTSTFVGMQLEEGDTETEYESYIDPTSVTVNVRGKNLFDRDRYIALYPSVTDNADGSFTIEATGGAGQTYVNLSCALPNNLEGQTIAIFGSWVASAANLGGLRVMWYDKTIGAYAGSIAAIASTSGVSATGVVPKRPSDNSELRLLIYINTSGTLALGDTITYRNIQVEIGGVATDYESYTSAAYTPAIDGSVDIVSVSPVMTLMTDTSGVVVEATYSRDINKVLSDIYTALERINGLLST